MNILVIGGTQFVGRHFVEVAIRNGHQVVLFNRGKTNPDLFKNVETIIGDRFENLSGLRGKKFDCVLDTSGYFPKNVELVTSAFKQNVERYIFVSTCSVYDHNNQSIQNFDENAPLVDLNVDVEDKSWDTYGARKYLSEEKVRSTFPNNHLIVRPGLIVGPYDPTYRFPYWGDRVSEGGEVLAPGNPDAPLQFIDARDLTAWLLSAIENELTGTFNTVSPHGRLTLGQFLETVREVINPACKIKWVDEKFLKEHGVACWSELPLWAYQEIQGFLKINSNKAIDQGLKFKPIVKTISDTHNWSKQIYKKEFMHKTLAREKELALLKDYSILNTTVDSI